MNINRIRVSVIIPVYNLKNSIRKCLQSLKNQNYPFDRMEIFLIDDGSVDGSISMCQEYANRFSNIILLCQEHKGVSAARNRGLLAASGKYIFFLDADDTMSSNTIRDCVQFFETVQNKVDLITYPIETICQGRKLEPHFRYQYLRENGIYDLCQNAFIGQTTMNIVVKNRFSKNILFDESLTFSEDQSYCCEVLNDKLKMGFCSTGKYIYHRTYESASGQLAGACYIFEQSLSFFERLFESYEHVPMAFQGLFVNDIYWKMRSNIFFPYHYDTEEYRKSMLRVKRLLQKCYNAVFLDHPAIDFFEKFYLMRFKGKEYIVPTVWESEVALHSEGYLVLLEKSVELVLTKDSVNGRKIKLNGFLKSVFFQFYDDMPKIYVVENGSEERELRLSPSVHNYYLSHEPTQRFWKMEYCCEASAVGSAAFFVQIGTVRLPVSYYFMPLIPFSYKYKYFSYKKDSVKIILNKDNTWNFVLYNEKDQKEKIWLYYDCKGVAVDNGLLQFQHDCSRRDGVNRYYVVTDIRQTEYISDLKKSVEFGSQEHKKLILKAEKIITAYIENNNIFPFTEKEYERFANQFRFETVYLQHGVLHIDMPWKYSPEVIIADKVVVSSDVDTELFIKNGFSEDDLWKTKMPRFDLFSHKMGKQNKILFAPTWRSYLTGEDLSPLENKFQNSNYFQNMADFLRSEELIILLKRYDYKLDIKLHPIFSGYEKYFYTSDDRISVVQNIVREEYALFITDFSSLLFDFLYLEVPILSFIPDYIEFKCGMNGYRKVDFLDKVNVDDICKNVGEIVDKLKWFFETGKGMDYKVRFYGRKKSARETIYKLLRNEGA